MGLFAKPSLTSRIAVGKGVGLLFGVIGFVALPLLVAEPDPHLRWGILLWYPTVGAVIGVFGVYSRHPVLPLPLPWWLLGPIIGGWMNFVLMLFIHAPLTTLMTEIFGADGWFRSPGWIVAEGAVVGLVIAALATRLGGEGPETLAASG